VRLRARAMAWHASRGLSLGIVRWAMSGQVAAADAAAGAARLPGIETRPKSSARTRQATWARRVR
jgi:hypothetical protein